MQIALCQQSYCVLYILYSWIVLCVSFGMCLITEHYEDVIKLEYVLDN